MNMNKYIKPLSLSRHYSDRTAVVSEFFRL